MSKFVVTTDSCADFFKSDYEKMNVPYIIIKRILDGVEISEVYDSEQECEEFYEKLKNGERPTTVAGNEQEFIEFFTKVLSETKGDIVHICLSSGLSVTYDNAIKAVEAMQPKLNGRKIHIVDSLIATWGMAMLVERLVEMRDVGMDTGEAIEKIKEIRDHQQGWFVITDLFHAKRGGRISGTKAMIGSVLGIKPIMIIAKNGKLAIQGKAIGAKKAVKYLVDKVEEMGAKVRDKFMDTTLYIVRTTKGEIYEDIKKALAEKFPKLKVKEGIMGPTIGTHAGSTATAILFEGAPRLDLKA